MALKMPVHKIYNEMPYEEYVGWIAYFERRPIGWREDHRTFQLIQTVRGLAGGDKIKPWDMFPSLYPIYNPPQPKELEGDGTLRNFKASAIFCKLLSAKGGDKLDVD